MSLSVQEALGHVTATLGDSDVQTDIDPLAMVNIAGQLLVSMNEWHFLQQNEVDLSLVDGQPFVDLPADFKAMRFIEHANSLTSAIHMTTLAEILQRRVTALGNFQDFWGAIEFSLDANGIPVQRLAVWPTPNSNTEGTLRAYYDRTWTEITDDVGYIPVPQYAVPLYVQILRAVCRGWEEEDEGSLDRRMLEIHAGPIYASAKRQDSRQQVEFGPLRNGIGGFESFATVPWWATGNSAGPS